MKLSIVTPSFNQARFLEACIDSVLNQNYPNLEYLVMDGGSSDLSVEILRTYGNSIIWVSEPDGGQAAAVNKGIERATGEIIGWLNSDDIYYPNSFETIMKVFAENPDVDVVYGHADHINEDGSYKEDYYTEPWDYERLKEICYLCQPAVFFRKKAVEEVGMLDPNRQYAMDYDLWLRMGKAHKFYYVYEKLAGSRLYATNKTLGFVEPVHLDIMDTVLKDTGSIPERWIQGSAESVARDMGHNSKDPISHRGYTSFVLKKMNEYIKRFGYNSEEALDKLPYSFASSLKIGIDASMALQESLQGVGVTSKELITALSGQYSHCCYYIYPAFEDHIEAFCLDNTEYNCIPNVQYAYFGSEFNVINHLRHIFGNQDENAIDKACKYPNVIFYPSFTFSRAMSDKCASVYMLYDLSFLEHVEYTTGANYNYCYKHVFNAALKADYFVAISNYTKKVFLDYFPSVNPERVRVAYLGCKEVYKNPPKDIGSQGFDINKPFWLSVGTVEPRKNIISLIYAYSELKKEGDTFPLYIAGGKGWKDNFIYKAVEDLGLKDSVHFLGFVTDEQLNALYHNCYAMIYPSYYEGFGLPILEAMTAGAPVITSSTTSMPEVGGDAAMYIDPHDRKSITEAMLTLQRNPDKREDMKRKGYEQSTTFDWENAARIVQKTIVDAVMDKPIAK